MEIRKDNETIRKSRIQAAEKLSISDLSQILSEKEDVFAVQIWQKVDAVNAFKSATADRVTPTEEQVRALMQETADCLEDCSNGWEILTDTVRHILGLDEDENNEEE